MLEGSAFRAAAPDHADLNRTALMSRAKPGRFNTERVGAVYLSREPETAIEELRRNAEGGMEPCAIFVVAVAVDQVLDLTQPDEIARWGLTAHDFVAEELHRCQAVAEAAVQLGTEAIRWPSATGRGESLALFIDRFGARSRVELVRSFDLDAAALCAIEQGVPLATLLPAIALFPPLR
jgi:RES domain-containing protein